MKLNSMPPEWVTCVPPWLELVCDCVGVEGVEGIKQDRSQVLVALSR